MRLSPVLLAWPTAMAVGILRSAAQRWFPSITMALRCDADAAVGKGTTVMDELLLCVLSLTMTKKKRPPRAHRSFLQPCN